MLHFFPRATSSQEESKVGKDLSFTWCLEGEGEAGRPHREEGKLPGFTCLNVLLEWMRDPGAQAHFIKFWNMFDIGGIWVCLLTM